MQWDLPKKKKVNKKILRENEVKYCNFTNFHKFRGKNCIF